MKKRSVIIDFVKKNGPCRRIDIIKFIIEKMKGQTFDPKLHRGYYSSAFWASYHPWLGQTNEGKDGTHRYGYLLYPCKDDVRYLVKNSDGLYAVFDYGK